MKQNKIIEVYALGVINMRQCMFGLTFDKINFEVTWFLELILVKSKFAWS